VRLLAITPEYPPHAAGGILKYYQLMASAWTAAGAEVSVLVSTPYSSFDDYDHQGIKVRFVPVEHVDRQADRLTHLAAAPTYRRWIAAALAATDWVRSRADAFDIIETTDFGLLFAPLVSLRDRPPVVVKLHGSLGQISRNEPSTPTTELDFALARMTEAAVLPCADALHAYSPANAAEWGSRLARSVRFVPAPLPLPAEKAVLPNREFAGVVVGRIQAWKGPELLCRAFRALGTTAPSDLKIAWIGRDTTSGPQGQSMSAWLAATYPDIWGKRVIPVGARTAGDVAALQASTPFAVVPSSWDTFNYTLPEAMSLGCVTLGSTGAGSSYLIEHGETGFRFGSDDSEALAQLMIRALTMNKAERQQMGSSARSAVAKQLDPLTCARTSLSAFASINASGRPELPGPWIREFFESSGRTAVGVGHLENVSIRELAGHLKTRVTRKLVG